MTEANEVAPTAATNLGGAGANKSKPSPVRWAILGVVAILLVMGFHRGLHYVLEAFTHESTDDAFLETDIVAVAPRVAGQVQAVHVKDNQWVNRGDLLVELDPRDFEVRVAQKRAATASADASLDSAKAGLAYIKAGYETAQANYREEQANVESARAKSLRAQAELKRDETLRQTGIVSQEVYDTSKADADSTAADLRAAEQKAAAAEAQAVQAQTQIGLALTLVNSAESRIKQTHTDQQVADLDLSYTKIFAPCDGKVTRKSVERGAYVQTGQSLLALVSSNLWVVANFKESQLDGMQLGQPAEIRIDAYPQRRLRGHVDSIMAGSGARFSLLPPENAVGNYVKVVQRVPVKILFDESPGPAMSLGPGMSVVPFVRISEFAISPVLMWLGALVLAALTTLGLGRVISHFQD